MSTLEMRLREGLNATALSIAADPGSKTRVIAKGERKRNMRRAIGSAALASVIALGVFAMPRLRDFTQTRIAPAGGSDIFEAGALDVAVTIPGGWDTTETDGAVLFETINDEQGVAVIDPHGVADPEDTFGVPSPGSLLLLPWARSHAGLVNFTTFDTEIGGLPATQLRATAVGNDPLDLVALEGSDELVLPAGSELSIYVPKDVTALVIAWAPRQDSLISGGPARIVAGLRFTRP
ncbi:MAG TPA: hypothetical protein VG408_02750 [Actinomycetota bacterium]|nr:hypothetical protein [Actinomycetota bacterium]